MTGWASSGHSGIDIGAPVGTSVKAIADGTIVAARDNMKGYGTGVFIDHGLINGKHITSEYGHLSSFNVTVGEKVKKRPNNCKIRKYRYFYRPTSAHHN